MKRDGDQREGNGQMRYARLISSLFSLQLCVDETVKNPKASGGMGEDQMAPAPRGGGMPGRGRGMRRR